ncbi:MAG: class I SAM-dependent methyltransferase [Mariniphaga sp.]
MDNQKKYFNSNGALPKKRGLNAYYWNEITQYIGYFAHQDSSVLEIGCGCGDLLANLPASRKVGIDLSDSNIKYANAKYCESGISFIHMDANDIRLTDTFDLIILSNLIGFVEDIQHVFQQVRKCCHPNTKIIVQYYNAIWEPLIRFAETIGLKVRTPLQNWVGI